MLERVNITLNMNLSITVNIYCVFLGGLTVVILTRPYIKKMGFKFKDFMSHMFIASYVMCCKWLPFSSYRPG